MRRFPGSQSVAASGISDEAVLAVAELVESE
jgi:hypothetical protein